MVAPAAPPGPGAPALLTQYDHRDWALRGVSRGFVGVVMPTGDTVDATWSVCPRTVHPCRANRTMQL